MADTIIKFQKEPIDIAAVLARAGTSRDGAIVSFAGQARDHSREREVKYLEYEIYEGMAGKELDKIAREAADKWNFTACTVVHRFGKVDVGEASILIAVSSPHRDESFKATRYIIDEIKKRVPIWKKEFYADGSHWISERC
jgi:molybdopterin synthase catalytic subunit